MNARRWLFPLLMAAGLLPWLFVQINLGLNGNVTWLVTAAERLLAGQSMAQSIYEVNPPLSLLYNLPPVLLGRILPAPLYYLVTGYFLVLIALSSVAVVFIAKRWAFLSAQQQNTLTAAYIIANTVLAALAIGEREQIVILGLMPFMMAQLCLTWGYALPKRLFWPVMIAGTLAVLIKPHFGLLPVLLLLHRAIMQRRFFSLMRDPDFLSLAAGTLLYIAFVWVFFRDYATVILPDVLALYVTNKSYGYALPLLLNHLFVFLLAAGIDSVLSPLKGREKALLMLLYAGALLALAPFAVQMKAFSYHLLPAQVLFACALGVSALAYIRAYAPRFPAPVLAVLLLLFGLAYARQPLLTAFPKHSDYAALPLAQELAKCPAPCPVFMFNDNMEILHPTFFYLGREHASRFPTFWFLPALLKDPENPEMMTYRRKYAAMVADDMQRYRPEMLIIGQYENPPGSGIILDFGDFFAVDPAFAAEWAGFRKDHTLEFSSHPYFAGTEHGERPLNLVYNVYLRK